MRGSIREKLAFRAATMRLREQYCTFEASGAI
jgi:hypothetical protein